MRTTVFCSLTFACALAAQVRTVTLTWNDDVNPAGTTYNVYRATGVCAGSPTFTRVNSTPIATKTYVDSGVAPGNYCYVVRAAAAGLESDDSNQAGAAVRPFAATGLGVTVQ